LTFAAMTARSYHGGSIVKAPVMDGTVRPFSSAIETTTWRTLATRGGGETGP
jgi:hypothetical protein